jgi:hypothetical protein
MHEENGKKGHGALRALLIAFVAYALVPLFGVGRYRNGSGQTFFENWYLLGFLVVSFFLMHELITPLPPKEKDETSPGKKSGREGSGRVLTPAESTGK